MSTSKIYQPIDIKASEAPIWPAVVPELTGPEATRAARRLWRFAMGEVFESAVKITSGNRYNWYRRGTLYLNPDRGWKHLLHDLSHLFVQRSNPGVKPHIKFHARFEAKLIREVIKRGWLDGRLRDKPAAAIEAPAPGLNDKRQAKLTRIEAALVRWESKQKRAQRAIAKLVKQQRYYVKALAGSES
jgi:hypothetical protein